MASDVITIVTGTNAYLGIGNKEGIICPLPTIVTYLVISVLSNNDQNSYCMLALRTSIQLFKNKQQNSKNKAFYLIKIG